MWMRWMNMAFPVWVGHRVAITSKLSARYSMQVLHQISAIRTIPHPWYGLVDVVQMTDRALMLILRRVCSGHTAIVDLLLKGNASVNNIGMKNMTALLAAIKGGHAETGLRLLENRTIDIKIQDKVNEKRSYERRIEDCRSRMDKLRWVTPVQKVWSILSVNLCNAMPMWTQWIKYDSRPVIQIGS